MDQKSKLITISTLLSDVSPIGESETKIISECLNIIREVSPIDGPLIFSKMERVVSLSDDLAWIISMLNVTRNGIKRDVMKAKDPKYVSLVRQNRPSSAAIEAEIRLSNKDIVDLETKEDNISIVIDYLNNIQKSLDRYLWVLKDKEQYSK